MVQKLIRDGKVAVLVSKGFGAGWSTWNHDETEMLFDPEIAQLLEDGVPKHQIEKLASKKYPNAYLGGLGDLVVQWLPVGAKFIVEEYDGAESLLVNIETTWKVA